MAGKYPECKVCPFDFFNKNLMIPRGYLVVPSGYHRKKDPTVGIPFSERPRRFYAL
jgi:hypothetical protein